jgi:hypothetical protein
VSRDPCTHVDAIAGPAVWHRKTEPLHAPTIRAASELIDLIENAASGVRQMSFDLRKLSCLRVFALVLLLAASPAVPVLAGETTDLPEQLPPPRPDFSATTASDPDTAEAEEEGDATASDDASSDEEALEAAAALRRPSFDDAETRRCEQELQAMGAQFEVIEPVGEDEAHCGAERAVTLSSIAGIAIEPSATARCGMALGFAKWVQDVVAPMAELYLDDEATTIGTSGSYTCRFRRGGENSTAFSQHAFANAIDVASISFKERNPLQITLPDENAEDERLFQAAIRGGGCAYFTTVIGPMTNAAHADHLHFDMAERQGGFRLCQ